MKKVGIIGAFDFLHDSTDGQTVKTKTVANELDRAFGKQNVLKIDSHGRWLFLLKMPFLLFKVLFCCKNVVILPAHNGVRIIPPLLYILNVFFHRKLHYVVIGGWLPFFIQKKNVLKFVLKHFDKIYVETTVMKAALEKLGFPNISIMPNCKSLCILAENDLKSYVELPLKFCCFSRVMKKKGIADAVNAINKLNEKYDKNVCCLDIYGKIAEDELIWFENLKKTFSRNISYCGVAPFYNSVEILKEYDALIFPTLFYTEGVPGTIIDAYAAGIPVISSRWESFFDVVDEGVVGFGYEFGSFDALFQLLENLIAKPESLIRMKKACVNKAKMYIPSMALKGLVENIEGEKK